MLIALCVITEKEINPTCFCSSTIRKQKDYKVKMASVDVNQKHVDQFTIILVSGYLRLTIQNFLKDKVFPQELVDICIIFYFMIECFDMIPKEIKCCDNDKTITLPLNNLHQISKNIFGLITADCNINNVIYKWIIKINYTGLECAVGVIDADKLNEYIKERQCFRYQKGMHYVYRENGYIHDHTALSRGHHVQYANYGSGDKIIIKIHTIKQTISFYRDTQLIEEINHIRMRKYKLCVYLWSHVKYGDASVTIQEFTIQYVPTKKQR